MMLLQLSAGQGPKECQQALVLAARQLALEASALDVTLTPVSEQGDDARSLLYALSGQGAQALVRCWQGTLLWVCQSPFRPRHGRKNWFFSGRGFAVSEPALNEGIQYKACKASGPGGQHVNKTASAIQAVHLESGLRVAVSSERSQHANKRLARALLLQKLAERQQQARDQQQRRRWQQHWELERGKPLRTFVGPGFVEK